jgi:hypothetical protein
MAIATQYMVRSQDMTTGKLETQSYDNLEYAKIHYNGFDTRNDNRLVKIEQHKGQTVYTDLQV